MKWKSTPLIKIYEALGALADKRYEIAGNTATVFSSSGNKHYDVDYEPSTNSITSNDNGSFWVGYLGYPAIVLLLALNVIEYDHGLAKYLKGFPWKDINQKFKNDFAKTQKYIDRQVASKYDVDIDDFHRKLKQLQEKINTLGLNKLPSDKKPPAAY